MAAAKKNAVVPIALDRIRTDGGTQMRVDLNEDVVDEYAQTVRSGTDLPPIVVFLDGSKHWLADGFHRFFGYRKAGAQTIQAEVRAGTKRDAVLYSVGANASHGLRRTNEDKRKAVLTLLKDKEWSQWSDREIARQAGVSHPLVSGLRSEVTGNSSSEKRAFTTKHGQRSEMTVENIGKAAPPAVDEPAAAVKRAADRAEEQAENERLRDAAREALPDAIKAREKAKADAIAARRDEDGGSVDALEAQIAELTEANAALEADIEALRSENNTYAEMKVQWENGGYEEVVAGLKQQIAVLGKQVETESTDKVSYLKSMKMWRKRAEQLGYSNEEVIDLREGANG